MLSIIDSKPGLRLLSIDGGTLEGAISQLLIINEMMERLAVDVVLETKPLPCKQFDMIAGSGIGGWVAAAIGPLEMSPEDTLEELLILATTVFVDGDQRGEKKKFYDMKTLQESIEGLLERRGLEPDVKMSSFGNLACKTFLCVSPVVNMGTCQHLRTYRSRQSSLDCTLVEAICATMALDPWFPPIVIGKGIGRRTFAGVGQEFHNPTRELLKEAEMLFTKDNPVACLVNIGYRRTGIYNSDTVGFNTDEFAALDDSIAQNCAVIANELLFRLRGTGVYCRLSTELETGSPNLMDLGEEVQERIGVDTTTYLEQHETSRLVDRVVEDLKEGKGRATLDQINHSRGIVQTAKSVPRLSPYYVVRTKAWDFIVSKIINPKESKKEGQVILVISGIGGCGKTQMASYFVQEYGKRFSFIIFIEAKSATLLRNDLRDGVRSLGPEFSQMTYEDAFAYLSKNRDRQNWLLILDNADDIDLRMGDYIPESENGTIIITGRNRNLAALSPNTYLELGSMTDEEAFLTLLKAAHRHPSSLLEYEQNHARVLIGELGSLPLALVQAGSYCFKMSPNDPTSGHFSFGEYLKRFRVHRARLMNDSATASLDRYKYSVYATLNISYEALSASAKEFLHICAFFRHTMIPLQMIGVALHAKFKDPPGGLPSIKRPLMVVNIEERLKDLLSPTGSMIEVEETARNLQSFSLLSISISSEYMFISYHTLVNSWTRDFLNADSTTEYRAMATRVLTSSLTEDYHHRAQIYLTPHVLAILEDCEDGLHANDLSLFARQLRISGHWAESETLDTMVQEFCKIIYGERHEITIAAKESLALTYLEQGKYDSAVEIQEIVLQEWERQFGKDHPRTLAAMSRLGIIYFEQKRMADAYKLHEEVLQKRQAMLGPNHPDTLDEAVYFARSVENLDVIEDMVEGILRVRQEQDGKDSPTLISALTLLAEVKSALSKPKEGVLALQSLVGIIEKALGKGHPSVVQPLLSLAYLHGTLCQWSEAGAICNYILKSQGNILREDHPQMITARAILVTHNVLNNDYDSDEAHRGLISEISHISALAKISEHPDVEQVRLELGMLLPFVYPETIWELRDVVSNRKIQPAPNGINSKRRRFITLPFDFSLLEE